MSRRDDIIQKISRRLRLDPVTGCHLWTGPTSGTKGRGRGYGRMSLNGQTVAVHLVVFCHYHGYAPSKRQVDHTCRNRLCCNPTHLELVTPKENQKRRRKASCIAAKNTPSTKLLELPEVLPRIQTDATTAGSCGKKLCSKLEYVSTGLLKQQDLLDAHLQRIVEVCHGLPNTLQQL